MEELLGTSQFTPRPCLKGTRSLRPEIPAQGAEVPAPRGGISGLPLEKLQEKLPQTKLDTSEREQWFRDKLGLRTRYQTVLIWYVTHVCKMQR